MTATTALRRINLHTHYPAPAGAVRAPRVYLSGPMTGLPELNFPSFHAQADRLRALGYDVVNPAEINPDASMAWNECMRADIKALVDCDVIALLPGWTTSTGAHLELHISHRIGIQVRMVEEL